MREVLERQQSQAPDLAASKLALVLHSIGSPEDPITMKPALMKLAFVFCSIREPEAAHSLTKTLLELPIVAGAIGELQMPDAVLLATLVPLADVATGVLVSPSAHFDRPCAVLALTLALLVVSMLTLLVGVLLVLVLDSGRGHAHAAHVIIVVVHGHCSATARDALQHPPPPHA